MIGRNRRRAKEKLEKTFLDAACSGDILKVRAFFSEKETSKDDESAETANSILSIFSIRRTPVAIDVNCCNANNCTALHLAAFKGHLGIVQVLVETAKIDLRKTQRDGWTALHLAIHANHLDVVEYLLSQDPELACTGQEMHLQPLHLASTKGNLEMVESLVKKNAVLDAETVKGRTALHNASQQGFLPIVAYLVQKGATVDFPDKDGWTPLFLAAQNGRLAVVQFLLSAGARVEVQDKPRQSTPLHVASYAGHLAVVKMLVDHGADIHAKLQLPGSSVTPRELAEIKGHRFVAAYFDELREKAALSNNPNGESGVAVPVTENGPSNGASESEDHFVNRSSFSTPNSTMKADAMQAPGTPQTEGEDTFEDAQGEDGDYEDVPLSGEEKASSSLFTNAWQSTPLPEFVTQDDFYR